MLSFDEALADDQRWTLLDALNSHRQPLLDLDLERIAIHGSLF